MRYPATTGVARLLVAVTTERIVKASARFSGRATSPVRRCTTVLMSRKEVPARRQAANKGARPAESVGSRSVPTPAAEAQKTAAARDGRGPRRSSQRPAATAKNAGKSETQASIAPTSNVSAPCARASSVTVKRMPVVHECMTSSTRRSLARRRYMTGRIGCFPK